MGRVLIWEQSGIEPVFEGEAGGEVDGGGCEFKIVTLQSDMYCTTPMLRWTEFKSAILWGYGTESSYETP